MARGATERSKPQRGTGPEAPAARARRLGAVVLQSVKDLLVDSGPQWAAAVAFYGLLAVFPLLLAGASVAAFVADPQWVVERATSLPGEFAPGGEGRIEEIVQQAIAGRGPAGIFSLGALLWTGTRVFGSLTQALNVVYEAREGYGFVKRLLIELVMLLTLGVVLLFALVSGLLVDLLWRITDLLPAGQAFVVTVSRSVVRALALLVAFFLILHFVPRRRIELRATAFGAGVATLLFLAARPLFLFYVERFGNYNWIYGPLALAILLLLWIWLAALIVLFGGELAAHTQTMLIEGQPAEEVGRRHAERSPAGEG